MLATFYIDRDRARGEVPVNKSHYCDMTSLPHLRKPFPVHS